MRVRVSDGMTLGGTMNRIRTWLDQRKIQPKSFHTAVRDGGFLLTITFYNETEAVLFREQFQPQ